MGSRARQAVSPILALYAHILCVIADFFIDHSTHLKKVIEVEQVREDFKFKNHTVKLDYPSPAFVPSAAKPIAV